MGLRVTGNGGGDWNVLVSGDEIVGAEIGLHPQCEASVEFDVDTLLSLSQGQLTPEEALEMCRLQTSSRFPRSRFLDVFRRLLDSCPSEAGV